MVVSISGSYAWRGRPETARAAVDWGVLADVRRIHEQHRRAIRKVVGSTMRDHLQLTIAALTMAIQQQRPGRGLIHHSDRAVNMPRRPRVAERVAQTSI